jgi:hypothetical protein
MDDAAAEIDEAVAGGSVTGACIDDYTVAGQEGRRCIVRVYEKYDGQAGVRQTLTVVIDNITGQTRIHSMDGGDEPGCVCGWGAAGSFAADVRDALQGFMLKP